MSEVIVRMEMPQSCPCELAGGYEMPFPCFAGHGVPARCKEFDQCVENGTKPGWCPFVCELPENHGDLIDKQSFIKRLYRYSGIVKQILPSEVFELYLQILKDVEGEVNKETVIVPATKEEG